MPQLIEGSPVFIQGSGAKPYELKNTGGLTRIRGLLLRIC